MMTVLQEAMIGEAKQGWDLEHALPVG